MENYDFSGWATRNDLLCGDGRTIRRNAFKDDDGATVPLVWNHQHNDPENVLGHALLENRDDGVYAYCTFNDTEAGQAAKTLVQHGDVRSLSIYANKLKQMGKDVIHGKIRELSLVLAGANPGAYIDFVMAHGEDGEDGFIASYDESAIVVCHSSETKAEEPTKKEEDTKMAEDPKKTEDGEKTVQDVIDSMTEEQKTVMYAMVGQALEEAGVTDEEDDKEEKDMKHNVFDNDTETQGNFLSHSDQEDILKMAKSSQVGSFQAALEIYADDNDLQHDAIKQAICSAGAFL